MVWLKTASKFSLIYQKIKRLPYISNKGPDFNNKILDLLRNREDLK